MNQLDYVTRSLVRAAAWRLMRHVPWFVAAAILLLGFVLEHMK